MSNKKKIIKSTKKKVLKVSNAPRPPSKRKSDPKKPPKVRPPASPVVPRIRPCAPCSKVFHKNCCKYKLKEQPLRRNQCNMGIQCPSKAIPLPLPTRSRIRPLRLPETVVMDMRTVDAARRTVRSFKKTLVNVHIPEPELYEGEERTLRRLRHLDRKPRLVQRRGRERPFHSDMDSDCDEKWP
ncbi:hypothetical protein KR009_003169 [Drosophila setifemur]|nr:hypothetical protein KR009_003169 [Drosophila setifemur]